MIDPKIEIAQFVAKEEQAAKAWFGSNIVPLGVGIAIGIIVMAIIHHL